MNIFIPHNTATKPDSNLEDKTSHSSTVHPFGISIQELSFPDQISSPSTLDVSLYFSSQSEPMFDEMQKTCISIYSSDDIFFDEKPSKSPDNQTKFLTDKTHTQLLTNRSLQIDLQPKSSDEITLHVRVSTEQLLHFSSNIQNTEQIGNNNKTNSFHFSEQTIDLEHKHILQLDPSKPHNTESCNLNAFPEIPMETTGLIHLRNFLNTLGNIPSIESLDFRITMQFISKEEPPKKTTPNSLKETSSALLTGTTPIPSLEATPKPSSINKNTKENKIEVCYELKADITGPVKSNFKVKQPCQKDVNFQYQNPDSIRSNANQLFYMAIRSWNYLVTAHFQCQWTQNQQQKHWQTKIDELDTTIKAERFLQSIDHSLVNARQSITDQIQILAPIVNQALDVIQIETELCKSHENLQRAFPSDTKNDQSNSIEKIFKRTLTIGTDNYRWLEYSKNKKRFWCLVLKRQNQKPYLNRIYASVINQNQIVIQSSMKISIFNLNILLMLLCLGESKQQTNRFIESIHINNCHGTQDGKHKYAASKAGIYLRETEPEYQKTITAVKLFIENGFKRKCKNGLMEHISINQNNAKSKIFVHPITQLNDRLQPQNADIIIDLYCYAARGGILKQEYQKDKADENSLASLEKQIQEYLDREDMDKISNQVALQKQPVQQIASQLSDKKFITIQ